MKPLVAGTLLGSQPLRSQIRTAQKAKIDLLEIRLDTFPFISSDIQKSTLGARHLLKDIRRKTKIPFLLTLRSYKEAGRVIPKSKRLPHSIRQAILTPLIPQVDLVDVEICEMAYAQKMTAQIKRSKKKVIHSFHDFKGVPSIRRLNHISQLSQKLKGDFLKCAVMPRRNRDLVRFLKWGSAAHPHPILIGMGHKGIISRFVGYSFGSQISFGHLGGAAAPGQPSVKSLMAFKRYYHV